VFEDWDDKLRYGVSFYLLVLIWKELGQLADENEEAEFLLNSGYFRDVEPVLTAEKPTVLFCNIS
jgi:hypothetical protein